MVQDCRESHNRGAELWGIEFSYGAKDLNF